MEYTLIIDCDQGRINIPFPNIKFLDEFTMLFDNGQQLFSFLNRALKIDVDRENLFGMHIQHTFTRKNEEHTKVTEKLDLKYASDNYDKDSVFNTYTKFLCDDKKRILEEQGFRNVAHIKIVGFVKFNAELSDRDVYLAARAYFNAKSNYRVYRDAYFTLKRAGYKVKINQVKEWSYDKTNLNNYNVNDEYLESLVNGVRLGYVDIDEAMEELSEMDLEELKRKLQNSKYGLFDGMGVKASDEVYDMDRMLALMRLSGNDYQKLLATVVDAKTNRKNGPKR